MGREGLSRAFVEGAKAPTDFYMSPSIKVFTGGVFETHCYYLPDSKLLVDAPEGAIDWLDSRGYSVSGLLLTHGHIDHVWDAARIQREQGCPVYYHPETTVMIQNRNFFRQFGMPWEVDPVAPGVEVEERRDWRVEGVEFQVLYVPGHCPGSLCFLDESAGVLFGGDVLFRGGVGRWDLPGGDRDLLLAGIRTKLMVLPDEVKVLPGHGPVTTIGLERSENPYVVGEL